MPRRFVRTLGPVCAQYCVRSTSTVVGWSGDVARRGGPTPGLALGRAKAHPSARPRSGQSMASGRFVWLAIAAQGGPAQRTGAGLAKHILQYPRTVGTERFQLKTISVAGTGTSAKINQPEPRLHRNFDF